MERASSGHMSKEIGRRGAVLSTTLAVMLAPAQARSQTTLADPVAK
jgi:hypothetical protein